MAVSHIIVMSVGALLIILGIIAYVVLGNVQRDAFRAALTLDSPNSDLFKAFVNPYEADARPFYTAFNVFNLTNLAAVKAGTEKPNFATVGPFTYRTYVSRENVSFSADGNLVTWQTERWVYRYEPSTAFPSDSNVMITNVNGFYAVAVYGAAAQGGEAALSVSFLAGVLGQLASTATVATAWGGDATYCFQSVFCGFAQYTNGSTTFAAAQSAAILTAFGNATLLGTYLALGASLPTTGAALNANFPTFGINHTSSAGQAVAASLLQYLSARLATARALTGASIGQNDGLLFRTISAHDVIFGPDPFFFLATKIAAGFTTNNSVYPATTLHTGKAGDAYLNLDYYTQVWGKTWTNAYGPNISTVGRSSSTAPFQDELPARFSVYVGEIQRIVPLVKGPSTTVLDVPTTRYAISFGDVMVVDPLWGNTVPGFLAVGAALGGLPVFMGLPNYGPTTTPAAYSTPTYLRDAVTGIDSTKTAQSFLDIEPLTGLPLNVSKAVQLNMLLNLTGFQDCPNLRPESKTLMLPILWSTQSSAITTKQGALFFQGIVMIRNMRIALLVFLVGLGAVLVICGAAFLWAAQRRSEAEPTSQDGDDCGKVRPTPIPIAK